MTASGYFLLESPFLTHSWPIWTLLCTPDSHILGFCLGLANGSHHRRWEGRRRERWGYFFPAPTSPSLWLWQQLPPSTASVSYPLSRLQLSLGAGNTTCFSSSFQPRSHKSFPLLLVSGCPDISCWVL